MCHLLAAMLLSVCTSNEKNMLRKEFGANVRAFIRLSHAQTLSRPLNDQLSTAGCVLLRIETKKTH